MEKRNEGFSMQLKAILCDRKPQPGMSALDEIPLDLLFWGA
jgi:hypothetical protein